MKSKAWTERVMQGVFFIAACTSVLAVALICIFLFANGIPAMKEIGFIRFLTGTQWKPNNNIYGILPMIVGSIYVTAGAVIVGVPIGILTAVFMAMYCPRKLYRPLKAATELLAGIPSVVYGFFGLVVLVPWIRSLGRWLKDLGVVRSPGNGNSILTASLLLGMMILPTIIGVTESAIRSVPAQYYPGNLAGSKIRCDCRDRTGSRPCDRRNDGSYYDCRKSAKNAAEPAQGRPHIDRQYCDGDGICCRTSQRGVDSDRRGTVCIYPDY